MHKSVGGIAHMFRGFRPLIRSRLPEIAAVVLVAMVGILGWLIWEYNRTVELLQHTVDVKTSILEVFSSVQNAESGNRGYILTGDELFLQHYSHVLAIASAAFTTRGSAGRS